jgi:hypothetical protein
LSIAAISLILDWFDTPQNVALWCNG